MATSKLTAMLENIAPIDIGADDISLDDDYERAWTSTPHKGNRGGEARSPLTPTLSLPDSFDGEYGGSGGNQQTPFNRDVEVKKMRAEVARVKELLQDRQGMFRDLKISDALYQQLRLRPENDLSTHELACLKTHEASLAPKKELEIARRTLQETQSQLVELKRKAEDAEASLARHVRQAQLNDDTHRMEMASLEERSTRLSQRLKEEMQGRQSNEEKATNYDRVNIELQRAQRELAAAQASLSSQTQQLLVLTQSEKEARAAERDSERVRELLVLDKSFLSQQVSNAEFQRDQQAKAAETAIARASSLEIKVQELGDKLLNQQLQSRSGLDDRVEKEISRVREDASRELELLRATHKEVVERENVILKDGKTAAEAAAESLKKQLALASGEVATLQAQLASLQSAKASEAAELRAELRLKTFELSSVGATLENRSSSLRELELELETVKGELAVHKAAFARLEGDTELANAGLKTQLQLAQSRLAAYEALEEEIDGAILRVARAGNTAAASGQTHAAEATTSEFLLSMKSVPSHPERRARQAVLLAQKVLELERQRDEGRAEVCLKEQQLATALRQLEVSKEALARTSQPTVYLVTKLRDEELAHGEALEQMQRFKSDRDAAVSAKEAALRDCEGLKQRLAALVNQRGEIESLRDLIETIAEEGLGLGSEQDGGWAGTGAGTGAGFGFNAGALDGLGLHPSSSVDDAPAPSASSLLSPSQGHDRRQGQAQGLRASLGLRVDTGASPSSSPRHQAQGQAQGQGQGQGHASPKAARSSPSPPLARAGAEAGVSPRRSSSPSSASASAPSAFASASPSASGAVAGSTTGSGGAGAGLLQRMMTSPTARASSSSPTNTSSGSPQGRPKGWHKREDLH